MEMREISGKRALVTGGARGMGKLWAEKLLADGANVILLDINKKELRGAESEFSRKYPGKVTTICADITDYAGLSGKIAKAEKAFGAIDILVNNAGIVAGGDFTEVPFEKHAATIDINLKGTIALSRAVLPGMIERNSGHIVNIASAAGFLGTPFMAPYNASKWGVIGFTESLMLEMKMRKRDGIFFTLVCPSYVDTGMFAGVRAPKLVPMLKPDRIVDIAYRAFRKNRYLVLEPFVVKFVPFLRGILPNRMFNFIANLLGVTRSMAAWHGREKR
jgi:short-subunit dehydrogenase